MLDEEVRKSIDSSLYRELGMTYEQFERLSFDEQQRILAQRRQKRKQRADNVTVMIGSGDSSSFIKAKRGQKVMIGTGDHACFIRAGISPEERLQEFEDRISDTIHSKPVSLIKKMTRRIRNNYR